MKNLCLPLQIISRKCDYTAIFLHIFNFITDLFFNLLPHWTFQGVLVGRHVGDPAGKISRRYGRSRYFRACRDFLARMSRSCYNDCQILYTTFLFNQDVEVRLGFRLNASGPSGAEPDRLHRGYKKPQRKVPCELCAGFFLCHQKIRG